MAENNGEYGVFAILSSGTHLDHNIASGSVEAGIYVGSSDNADATVTDNNTYDNGFFDSLSAMSRTARFEAAARTTTASV